MSGNDNADPEMREVRLLPWRSFYSRKNLKEAQDLFHQGKVKNLSRNDTGYSLRVRTDRYYSLDLETEYTTEDEEFVFSMACSCQDDHSHTPCIHAAAGLIALESFVGNSIQIRAEVFDGAAQNPNAAGKKPTGKQETGGGTGKQEAGKHETEKKAAKESSRAKAKEGSSSEVLPDLSALFPDMAALAAEDRDSRENSGDRQSTENLTDYRYFRMDEIETGLHISKELYQKAGRLVETEKVQISSFTVGSPMYFLASPEFAEYYDTHAKPVGNLVLACEGDYSYSGFRVNMIFGQNRLLWSRCGDWSCSTRRSDNSYLRRTLCAHEAAGILLLRKYLEQHTAYDTTSQAAIKMIEALTKASGTELTAQETLRRDALSLEPQLEVQGDGVLRCSFRAGNSRLYKVKNLHDFCSAMNQGMAMAFTPKVTLRLSENDLTEDAGCWYRFLSEEIRDEKARYQRYADQYYVPVSTDVMDLEGGRLDRFLELAMGKTIPVSFRGSGGRQKGSWSLRDKSPSMELSITPDQSRSSKTFEGIVVQGSLPRVYRGMHVGCWTDEGHLNRIGEEEMQRLQPILSGIRSDGSFWLRVGRHHLADFYHKALPQLRRIASITEHDSERIASFLPPEPAFTVYIDRDNDSFLCRAEAAYGAEIFSISDVADPAMQKSYQQYRDRGGEERIVKTVLRYFPRFDDRLKIFFVRRDEEEAFELLEHGLDELGGLPLCQVRMTDRFRRLGLRRNLQFDVGISLESNLLDLSVTARELSEEEMLQVLYQYQKKRRFIVLKNGDFLKIEENDSLRRLTQMMEDLHLSVKELTKGKMHLPAYRALYLDKMLEEQDGFYSDRDRHFKELIKGFKTVADSDYEVPQHLKKILRPYQKEGYRWIRTLDHYGFGGILADEMGLGKTLQVLAVLEAVKKEEDKIEGIAHTSLVVCPASLVYNWLEEARRFAPSLLAVTVAGTAEDRRKIIRNAGEADLLITSYDLLKRDVAEYDGQQFRFEILDEAQYIKTHTTAAAKSVKLIRAVTRLALTGTPIENRLSELWSIFDYLMPGFLFAYDHFRTQMELPIVKNEDAEIMERLHHMIGPFILRRNKRDVLKDLPDKLEEIRYAGMAGKQQKLYDAQVIRMRNDLKQQDENDFRRSKIEILAELTRIRQICCDPSLCYTNYDGESAKTDLCLELLHSLMDGGHRTLLFSQFTSMLDILRSRLDEEKIPYYIITGSTAKEERLKLVKAFNENEIPVFLISLKAGGTGLNLVGADSVIHYDPWWNTAAEDQASDRAHRIGQKNVVTVYKLVVKGTIEEKIVALQKQKAKLAGDILSGEGMGSASLSREDLLEILTCN